MRAEQLQLLFSGVPSTTFATALVASVVAVLFWRYGAYAAVVIWLTSILVATALRYLLWLAWQRDFDRFNRTARWRIYFLLSSFSMGAAWGLSTLWLFPANDVSGQMLTVFVTAGISAGAVLSLAADRRAAWCFLLPCVLPLVVQFHIHADGIGAGMSLMGILYLGVIASVINRSNNYIRDNVLLRLAAVERERAREEYEQALRASQEKLQALFELSPLACLLSTYDGKVVEANAAVSRLLGYTAAELNAQIIDVITPEHLRQENSQRWLSLFQHGRTDSFEREYIRKDGSTMIASVHRMAVDTRDGNHYVWSIIEDISVRKEIERQITTARAQLEAFIRNAPAAVAMLDLELRYVACSQRWLIDAQLAGKNIIGLRHYDLVPWLSEESRQLHQRCLAGAVESCDAERFEYPDGRVYWSRWEIRPWYDDRGRVGGIAIFTEDITERRHAEQALRARDELLQKLSERVPGFIYQYQHPVNGKPRFTYVSDAVHDVYELTPETVYADADALRARLHPDDRAVVAKAIAGSGARLTPWGLDYRVQLPGRGMRWLHGDAVGERHEDGTVIWYGYITDITDRKKVEEELQVLSSRLALATQAGAIGVWEWDLLGDTLIWDARMYEIYKVSPATPITTSNLPNAMVHPDDWEKLANTFTGAMYDRNASRYVCEYRILWPDDTERTIRSAGIFQRDASGQPHRVTGVTWDITESKKVERMKTEFVSTVSHELRTPLTSIRGSLGLVARGIVGELPAPAQELIEVAYKNSERLSLLINDILDIEKIESGKMRFNLIRQPLVPLIEQALAANLGYAQTYAVNVQLTTELSDIEVAVDGNRLLQVMANLISNAVKFSPQRAVVDVVVRAVGERIRIEVCDRGPGISAEFSERIFQRFSQADASDTRAQGGTGLGLAITKAIVEKMRGDIGFVARDGGGTIFFFELPRF